MSATICWRDKTRACDTSCEAYNDGTKVDVDNAGKSLPTTCLILQCLLSKGKLGGQLYKLLFQSND